MRGSRPGETANGLDVGHLAPHGPRGGVGRHAGLHELVEASLQVFLDLALHDLQSGGLEHGRCAPGLEFATPFSHVPPFLCAT